MENRSKRNENRLLYDTRWRHPNANDYILISAKTPFNKIIQTLEKIAGEKYNYNQVTALKQFYYNKKTPQGKPKWKKSLLDWMIEYKVGDKYVWSITNGLEKPVLDEKAKDSEDPIPNQIWTHELDPIVEKVEVNSDKFNRIKELVDAINFKVEHPDIEDLLNKMTEEFEGTSKARGPFEAKLKLFELTNQYNPLLVKIAALEHVELVTEKGVKATFRKKLKKLKGWTIENL